MATLVSATPPPIHAKSTDNEIDSNIMNDFLISLPIYDEYQQICGGYLQKKSRKGKWQKRWFILHGDLNAKPDLFNYSISYSYTPLDNKTKTRKTYPLYNAKIITDEIDQHRFILELAGKKTIELQVDGGNSRKKWIDSIEKIVEIGSQKRKEYLDSHPNEVDYIESHTMDESKKSPPVHPGGCVIS
jgi:hypothetical protein